MQKKFIKDDIKCALCLDVATLRKSHIIPEFFYKSVYDEKHSYLKISTDASKPLVPARKGIYERLLCGRCEGRMADWETYAAKVLMGGIGLYFQNEAWGLTVHGVDYARFKLFGMSLLWRAAVSKREEFTGVALGKHQERLRTMLDSENPGLFYEYGFSIVFSQSPKIRQMFSRAISPPQLFRYGAHHGYRFMLGFAIWLFPVSSHMDRIAQSMFSLLSDGTMRLRNGGRYLDEFIHDLSKDVASANAERSGRKKRG